MEIWLFFIVLIVIMAISCEEYRVCQWKRKAALSQTGGNGGE
jgi:hypothetical protein